MLKMDNLRCQGKIEADADIGGYGVSISLISRCGNLLTVKQVMASFIVMAWITMFFASLSAWNDLKDFWHKKPWRFHTYFMSYGVDARRTFAKRARRRIPTGTRLLGNSEEISALLSRLVDVQIATGIGIAVAGFSQISSITYYHGQLVSGYWWLTMQSFLVVPLDYTDLDVNAAGPAARIMAIIVSTVMGLTFSAYILVKEVVWGDWDWENGPCYRWYYSSWMWMGVVFVWLSGMYVIVLVLILIPRTRRWILSWDSQIRYWRTQLNLWFCRNYTNLVNSKDYTGAGRSRFLATVLSVARHAILVIVSGTAVLVYWLFVQLLAMNLAVGEGSYPFLFLVCTMFNAWNTLDIISLRILNDPLLGEEERKMGFGQVLPLTLIGPIFLPSAHAPVPS